MTEKLPGAPEGEPPVLTGGSEHLPLQAPRETQRQKEVIPFWHISQDLLICSRVDAFTVTLSTEAAQLLRENCKIMEEGLATQGFQQSEKVSFGGGIAWRRFKPHQKSKKWGKDYESWQFQGANSQAAFSLCEGLTNQEAMASRIDIAFDFACADYESTEYIDQFISKRIDDFNNATGEFIESPWRSCYRLGMPGEMTYYLPNIGRDNYLRVYRKDLQNPEYRKIYGVESILRFETQVKGDYAKRYWNARHDGAMFKCAAYDVLKFSGLVVPDEMPEKSIPLERVQSHGIAKKMISVFTQYKAFLTQCELLKIDPMKVSSALMQTQSRAAKSRHNANMKHIEEVGIYSIKNEFNDLLEALLKEYDIESLPQWDIEEPDDTEL